MRGRSTVNFRAKTLFACSAKVVLWVRAGPSKRPFRSDPSRRLQEE